jgi:hypothetical protein
MENPIELSVPENIIQRVHAFARDLAYGAAQGWWHTRITWQALSTPNINTFGKAYQDHLGKKWGEERPSEFLLLSFGYFQELTNSTAGLSVYLLTDKAFALLETPATPPNVFISYSRKDSTAFALLIEARLKLAGNPNPYIDKNLVAGEEWNTQLQERIRAARYFVVVIGANTLASPYVRQELDWAAQFGCTIISIWHDGAKIDANTPEILQTRHALKVSEESALGYEMAVNQLLNSLGYATY